MALFSLFLSFPLNFIEVELTNKIVYFESVQHDDLLYVPIDR